MIYIPAPALAMAYAINPDGGTGWGDSAQCVLGTREYKGETMWYLFAMDGSMGVRITWQTTEPAKPMPGLMMRINHSAIPKLRGTHNTFYSTETDELFIEDNRHCVTSIRIEHPTGFDGADYATKLFSGEKTVAYGETVVMMDRLALFAPSKYGFTKLVQKNRDSCITVMRIGRVIYPGNPSFSETKAPLYLEFPWGDENTLVSGRFTALKIEGVVAQVNAEGDDLFGTRMTKL